jgi:hypothetical protein
MKQKVSKVYYALVLVVGLCGFQTQASWEEDFENSKRTAISTLFNIGTYNSQENTLTLPLNDFSFTFTHNEVSIKFPGITPSIEDDVSRFLVQPSEPLIEKRVSNFNTVTISNDSDDLIDNYKEEKSCSDDDSDITVLARANKSFNEVIDNKNTYAADSLYYQALRDVFLEFQEKEESLKNILSLVTAHFKEHNIFFKSFLNRDDLKPSVVYFLNILDICDSNSQKYQIITDTFNELKTTYKRMINDLEDCPLEAVVNAVTNNPDIRFYDISMETVFMFLNTAEEVDNCMEDYEKKKQAARKLLRLLSQDHGLYKSDNAYEKTKELRRDLRFKFYDLYPSYSERQEIFDSYDMSEYPLDKTTLYNLKEGR